MRFILVVMLCTASFCFSAQETLRIQNGDQWSSEVSFDGFICVDEPVRAEIDVSGDGVDESFTIGPFIVGFNETNRTNPLCHPFSFKKKVSYTFSFAQPEEIIISSIEVEYKLHGQGYFKFYLFFFLITIFLFLLSAIVAVILYLVNKNISYLFYGGYLVCFSLFFLSRYESFFLFDFIKSYSSHVGSSDFVFSILGIIFYNLFVCHFLEFEKEVKDRFIKFNVFFFINMILCVLIFHFISIDFAVKYFDVIRVLMLGSVLYMIYCAWKKISPLNQFIIYGSISVLFFSMLANVLSYSQDYYGPDGWDHPLVYILIGFLVELLFFTLAVALKAKEEFKSFQELKLEVVQNQTIQSTPSKNQIVLSTNKSKQFIKVDQIIRCEAEGSYTRYIIKNKKDILVSYTLKDQEQQLPSDLFFRIHQSYLVNMNEIDQYFKTDGGYIKMTDGKIIPVSRNKKDKFFKRMEGE